MPAKTTCSNTILACDSGPRTQARGYSSRPAKVSATRGKERKKTPRRTQIVDAACEPPERAREAGEVVGTSGQVATARWLDATARRRLLCRKQHKNGTRQRAGQNVRQDSASRRAKFAVEHPRGRVTPS